MMRGGEMAVAEALVTRAAVASSLPLDEAGLQALLSPAATVQRPLPAPHAPTPSPADHPRRAVPGRARPRRSRGA